MATTDGLVVGACAAALGVGYLVALGGLRAGTRAHRQIRVRALGLAPALGLGLASLLMFLARSGGVVAIRPLLWSGMGLAALGGWAAGRRPALDRAETPPRAAPARRALRWAALLVALVSVGAVGQSLAAMARAWPAGTWDAVAIWNTRARLLARAPADLPGTFHHLDPASHPHYPLLVPGAVAALEALAGGESELAGALVGAGCLAGVGLLIFAAVARAGTPTFAALAAGAVVTTPMLTKWTAAQVADVPLAYLLLASALLLGERLRGDDDAAPPALCGLTLGLMVWTKNEGTVYAVVLGALYCAWSARRRRALAVEATALLAGALPGLIATAYFKLQWAPESGLDTFLRGAWRARLFDGARWGLPLVAIWHRLVPLGGSFGWGLVWPLVLGGCLLLARQRPSSPAPPFLISSLLAIAFSWLPIYASTPYDEAWHIESSLDRLLLQVFPLVLATLCVAAAARVQETAPDGA